METRKRGQSSDNMPDFYLIRFGNGKVAAVQVTAVEEGKPVTKLSKEVIAALEGRMPPKVGDSGEIESLKRLAGVLYQNEGEIDVHVSEDIKVALESAGVEFEVLARLRKP